MVANGLIQETQQLLSMGYPPNLPALTSLGYKEIGAYLRGDMTLPAAVERIQIETHRFVRHQYSWFRRMQAVNWFDVSAPRTEEMATRIADFLDAEN